MYSFIPRVEEILMEHDIYFSEQIEPEHVTINTDELMRDAGFAADRKVLDLFLDVDNHILFIGLLRLPKSYRQKKIGTEIVNQLIEWAEQNDYTLFLDSCGESTVFWRKCGFSMIEHRYGFDIMGLGQNLKDKWKERQQIFLETH